MFKGGGFVLLKEEMADPRKAVPYDQCQKNIGEIECEENSADELQQGQNTADDVQSATGAVGVLRQVKRVKLLQ